MAGNNGQGFSRRLTATVVLTVLLVGAAQYVLASRQLTERVLQQSVEGYEGDAIVLRALYDPQERNFDDVAELLAHIASRPGVLSALLIDADGEVLLEGTSHHTSMDGGHDGAAMDGTGSEEMAQPHGEMAAEHDAPEEMAQADVEMTAEDGAPEHGSSSADAAMRRPVVASVLGSGTSYAGTEVDPAGEMLVFAVPVDLTDEEAVLVVTSDAAGLNKQVSSVAWVLLMTLVLGSVLAVPLFHMLGGRALGRRHDRALRDSSRDALTGLGNHRAFHEEIRREVELARRHGHPLALITLDLDGFKEVNDRFGHRRGDAILEEVGGILLSGRTEDRPFRTGGDEFCVLLVSTSAEGAERVAEHIRRRIDVEVDGVTASVGIAELGVLAPDVESFIQEADKAMYAAKNAGRNQVTTAEHGITFPAGNAGPLQH